ncbi:hypothetical protein CKJ63_25350 [Mycobacterium avium]|nr:hypothetical protein CKJ63_25350 [Mycobacterium avium]PBA78705.1 hypothetical protein CKJ72_25390 [Mycobacterium avium]
MSATAKATEDAINVVENQQYRSTGGRSHDEFFKILPTRVIALRGPGELRVVSAQCLVEQVGVAADSQPKGTQRERGDSIGMQISQDRIEGVCFTATRAADDEVMGSGSG